MAAWLIVPATFSCLVRTVKENAARTHAFQSQSETRAALLRLANKKVIGVASRAYSDIIRKWFLQSGVVCGAFHEDSKR